MKVFFNKLKRANVVMKIFYFITMIGYWVTYGFFTKSLLSLAGIETVIRFLLIGLFAVFGIIYTIFGLVKMFQNKKVGFIVLTVFTLIFAVIFGFGSYYIDRLYGKLENFTTSDTSTYTTVLLAMSGTEYSNELVIGMVTDEEDRTGYILPLEYMSNEGMENTIEYYSNYTELLQALYSHEVDAIFITKDYATIYGGEETYQNIATETTVLKEYSKEMKTEESELLVSTKSLTEPFTVLVMGVDSESTDGLDANAAFNGDTLILVTFNPKTLTATMFSMPRDLYVPIISSSGRNLGYNKINSSAAYGTASTVNTVENLTGIEIDYFVKVNFQGVIDLVNALGGIDVEVEQPDYDYYVSQWGEGVLCESGADRTYVNMVCMNTGWQHLNGEQALAYARNRHGFLESDLARNRHQQQIIEAIAKKVAQTASFSDFEKLLDTISNNIATNMQTNQILSFYQSLKNMLLQALNGEDFITIQKTQLQTFSFRNMYGLSCLGYYTGSLDVIVEAMEENLGLSTVETITTFSYDYSEDYEQDSESIGKGIYSGTRSPDQSIYASDDTTDDNTEENTPTEPEEPVEPSDDENTGDSGSDNGSGSDTGNGEDNNPSIPGGPDSGDGSNTGNGDGGNTDDGGSDTGDNSDSGNTGDSGTGSGNGSNTGNGGSDITGEAPIEIPGNPS
ncbi:TPA: LCP family protein [Candidatus Ventrenecus stercoripullorum]|nr:LCP family protein [Candidatus Ventrenecus stercoripullorum]